MNENTDFSLRKFSQRIVSDITLLAVCKCADASDVYLGCVKIVLRKFGLSLKISR